MGDLMEEVNDIIINIPDKIENPDDKLPNTDLTFREAIEIIKAVADDYDDTIKEIHND